LGYISVFKRKYQGPIKVNIIGDVYSESGLGAITRQIISSIDGYVDCTIINMPMSKKSRQGGLHANQAHVANELHDGINIFVGNPDLLIRALLKYGPMPFIRGYCVGVWFWELEKIPSVWRQANKVIDEIWAQSHFIADSFSNDSNKVYVMPFTLDGVIPSQKSKADLGLPENKFNYLFSFDFLSHAKRKNPKAVVNSFIEAFGHQKDVALIIKSVNSKKSPAQFESLKERINSYKNIHLIDGYYDQSDVHRMIELCDCYVSLHRSEGLGLGMAEAMKVGTLVIATAYSGNLTFMNRSNALLVDYYLVPTHDDKYPYGKGNNWADIEIDSAVKNIKLAFDDNDLRRELTFQARLDMDKYSTDNQRLWIKDRLRKIQ
jgi:glycosyltransferase involved in cell wall biosynthesis